MQHRMDEHALLEQTEPGEPMSLLVYLQPMSAHSDSGGSQQIRP
ncbi:hypothetical protein [Xanthomonas albilineans]|nr:hypothetical protein [Xanthomonas albilineans]QHQ27802.1 hypothetical protein XaFJ1_GM001055 [Xanthomonas albilineans]